MALSLNTTTPFGLTLTGAYAKVTTFSGDKTNLDITVAWYVNKAARDENKRPINVQRLQVPTPTDGGTVAGIYTYLKTQPEFTGAGDL